MPACFALLPPKEAHLPFYAGNFERYVGDGAMWLLGKMVVAGSRLE